MNAVETWSSDPVPKTEDIRKRILQVEDALSQFPGAKFGDQEECPLKHTFAPGVYVREIFIPKGMLIVGKIHRHAHPNFLMRGDVAVFTEEKGWERLKAPRSIISAGGTKRIVFTYEDTVWVTVHATTKTNLEEIEKEIIAPTFEEYEAGLSLCPL